MIARTMPRANAPLPDMRLCVRRHAPLYCLMCRPEMEVAIMHRIPYSAWRRLIDFLWQDAAFTYCCIPRFLRDGSVEVLLLLNGSPKGGAKTTPAKPGRRLTKAGSERREAGQRRHTGAITEGR